MFFPNVCSVSGKYLGSFCVTLFPYYTITFVGGCREVYETLD
jgi:hypothetical protein